MEIPAELDRFEASMEVLRTKYEMFFSGRERKEPAAERAQLEANARRLTAAFISNSGLLYRLKSLTTRLTTYQGYWDRVLREMEEGTFSREIDRRKLTHQDQAKAREAERKGEDYIAMHEYSSGVLDDEIKRAAEDALHTMTTRTVAAAPAPKSGVEMLYDDYVAARKAGGEKLDGLSLEKFKKQVDSSIPAIRQKIGTDDFELKVVVRDGRATLRAFKKGG